jgi:hypothetical protein
MRKINPKHGESDERAKTCVLRPSFGCVAQCKIAERRRLADPSAWRAAASWGNSEAIVPIFIGRGAPMYAKARSSDLWLPVPRHHSLLFRAGRSATRISRRRGCRLNRRFRHRGLVDCNPGHNEQHTDHVLPAGDLCQNRDADQARRRWQQREHQGETRPRQAGHRQLIAHIRYHG